MIKVVGSAPCGAIQVTADPWLPLTVTWQLAARSGLLNLYVRGTSGGYVEMRIDERTGALAELVVIEAPPDKPLRCPVPSSPVATETVLLDREMWEWRVTADYTEPAKRDTSITQELSWSVSNDTISLLFGESPASQVVGSDDATVAFSDSGELVCIAVRKPDVELPPGYPVD